MKAPEQILRSLLASLFILNTALVCIAEQESQEKLNPALEKGIGQYKHENFDEAASSLKKARAEEPTSTLAAYYLGLTYKQMQDYKSAVAAFIDAVTYSPKIKGALIELIDSLYQLNMLDEAKKWIVEAEKEGIRPAQVSFLKGLVLLKAGDAKGAIGAFENAKSLDSSMKASSDYYLGIAYLKERKFTDARRAFNEVVNFDPGSNVATFANQYMDAIARAEAAEKLFRLEAGFAWQYDDNVILKPSDGSLAANISDKGDSREVYTLRGEWDKRFSERFGLKGAYSFYYSKQNDLGFYDTLSNSVLVQPSLYFDKSSLTFPVGWNHTSVNDKAYLSSPTANAIYSYMLNAANMLQAFVKYQYKDYLWTPSTADENRDSNDVGAGLGWYLFYKQNQGFVNLRYTFNDEEAEGNNWDYLGNRGTVTLLYPVMDKLNATISGDVYVQSFTNTHTVFQQKRNDKIYTISALLAYKIWKDSEVQLQYTHVKDDSNIGIYDYSRNIYSAGVDIKF